MNFTKIDPASYLFMGMDASGSGNEFFKGLSNALFGDRPAAELVLRVQKSQREIH